MNATHQHVIEAINELKVWPEHKFQVQKRLGDGPTNETWLVTHAQERYVLRLVKPLAASMALSLEQELHIARVAGQHNLTAPVVASCTTLGIVLSRHLDGKTWTAKDLHDKKQLSRLANTLQRLHSLDCEVRPLNLRSTVTNYAQLSVDPRADKWAEKIFAQMEGISWRAPVVCHNDVTAANVVDDGHVYLIDWEYAALGDPLFDLAVVVAHHELDENTTQHFLNAYLGGSDPKAHADLLRWCLVYKSLLALWLSVLEAETSAPLTP